MYKKKTAKNQSESQKAKCSFPPTVVPGAVFCIQNISMMN